MQQTAPKFMTSVKARFVGPPHPHGVSQDAAGADMGP